MTTKTTLRIPWSIHFCIKSYIKKPKNWKKGQGVEGGCTSGFMSVKKEGRKKIKKLHKTLGEALNEVGV